MRHKDKQIEDKAELEAVLDEGQFITLCLMDGQEPYMVPMDYCYADGKIFFHSGKAGRKVEVMAKNNKVKALLVVDAELFKAKQNNIACSMTTRFKSVMIDGEVELLTDQIKAREGMLALLKHAHAGHLELPENSMQAVNMYCLHIKSMVGKKNYR